MKSKIENLKLLIGMPEKTAWGGVNACEPPFVEALKNIGVSVAEETYIFDHKARNTKPHQRIGNVLQTARRFRQLLRENHFDVLHLNTAFDLKAVLRDVATVSLIKNNRTKIFLKMHGSEKEFLETKNAAKRTMWRQLFAKVDGIGVLSSEEKDNFANAGVDAQKIFVVKNAVRVPKNLPPREFNRKPLQLVFASRLIESKGLLDLIRAAAVLREKKINFVLYCLGDGEIRAEAEKLTDELRLRESISILGHVSEDEVNEFYLKSDLLAFPTFHAEGFPMVVFNALAHGLPIVTTKIRAAADYLREPDNVLWTLPKNPESLAAKIVELIENENLRRQMSENNRKLAANFTAERVAPEYLEIYQKILAADELG